MIFSHCGALLPEENDQTACIALANFAARTHTVELIATSHDAFLYRASP
jgi:hypothetical protein